MDAEGNKTSRKRRRPATSCDQCRRRKVKCDQNAPCAQCIRSKTESCSYHPFGSSSGLVSEIPSPAGDTSSEKRVRESTRSLAKGPSNSRRSKIGPSVETVRELQAKVWSLEQRLAQAATIDIESRPTPALQGVYEKTRLLGRSHWINSCQDFTRLWKFKSLIESGQHPDIVSLMDKCKNLARQIKAQVPRQQPHDLRVLLPPRTTCDILVKAYFRTFESVYRILHVPSFEQEYLQYWENCNSVNQAFVVKLLLILAIGSCFQTDSSEFDTIRSSAAQWIAAAQLWLNSPFAEKSRMTITGLQVHCVLLVARETNAIGGDLIWIPAGSLVRTARLMGLHRDPSHFPRMSDLQAQMRRRLWATILELALHSSMNVGGHPLLSEALQDGDCEAPLNINDDQLSSDGGGRGEDLTPVTKSQDVYTDSSLQLALMKTWPLRLEIANLLNGKRSEPTYEETLQLSTTFTSTYSKLIRQLERFQCGSQERKPNHFHIELFKLLHTRYIHALHDRFATKASINPTYYFSRKICLETSLILVSPLFSYLPTEVDNLSKESSKNGHRDSEQLRNDHDSPSDFYNLIVTGGGSYRSILFHASLLLYFELVNQRQELADVSSSSFSSLSASKLLHGEIHHNLISYKTLLLQRISKGNETNIKGFIFSSAMLTELELEPETQQSEEGEKDVEEKAQSAMIQAMRLSVQICHDILTDKKIAADSRRQLQSQLPILQSTQPRDEAVHDHQRQQQQQEEQSLPTPNSTTTLPPPLFSPPPSIPTTMKSIEEQSQSQSQTQEDPFDWDDMMIMDSELDLFNFDFDFGIDSDFQF